jgi:antitoxin component YwqK of YwqJK toxin-antitoxin module
MRKLIAAMFVALLMVGCGEVVDMDKLQYRDGVVYLPDEDTPFTGRAESFNDNWQKRGESNYKDGKLHGLSTYWYGNGQKQREKTYKDGKTWSAVVWKPNGEKCPVTNVVNGSGVVVDYHEDGQKESEGNYKDGKQHGLWTWWHENGQKESERNYKDGWEDGLWIIYFRDGTGKSRETYKDGERVSSTEYYFNGQKQWGSTYKDGKVMTIVSWKPLHGGGAVGVVYSADFFVVLVGICSPSL